MTGLLERHEWGIAETFHTSPVELRVLTVDQLLTAVAILDHRAQPAPQVRTLREATRG